MTKKLIPMYTEVECKYRVTIEDLPKFIQVVEVLPGLVEFLHTIGPDTYYTRNSEEFGRYRVAKYPVNGEKWAQWTVKVKPEGAKNNVFRFESNWLVSGTPPEEIEAGALAMGYKKNFKINKYCHIFKFEDATVVFYTVREDGSDKNDHFVEIEVTEETIHKLTEDEAWNIIGKYEKILEPIGLNAQRRLRKSLFEMYVK